MSNIFLRFKRMITSRILPQPMFKASPTDSIAAGKDPEYFKWIYSELINIANDFFTLQDFSNSSFIKDINRCFRTERFTLLVKRWFVDYLLSFFDMLYAYCPPSGQQRGKIELEDNPLNRFGIKQYSKKFGVSVKVLWRPQGNFIQRLGSIAPVIMFILYLSLKNGIRLKRNKKQYKVLREAIWGIENKGIFFHDDFLVDGKMIKKEDILFFSRGVAGQDFSGRRAAYAEVKKAGYDGVILPFLKIGIGRFLSRILPLYICRGPRYLLRNIQSDNFSLFRNIYHYFVMTAVPYEKVFSNYSILSELGHNYFSASHVSESIVCQNTGVRYYLMHWSDIALDTTRIYFCFLSCDRFLMWGMAHARGVVVDNNDILTPVGYVFKRFIREVVSNKQLILSKMGIQSRGKIISFFDESFGQDCDMTEDCYMDFWKLTLEFARVFKDCTIVIKQKGLERSENLSSGLKNTFSDILGELQNMPNVNIIDPQKWSFIEVIGISDIVVSQGMTSSSTIAIVCGVNGLYFDRLHTSHAFSQLYKDKIVFDDQAKIIAMAHRFIKGDDSVTRIIPEKIIRDFDKYDDDLGIERFRKVLVDDELV